ncbi:MAG TPA: hypothetical protein VFB08_18680 [Burkholderiales bacterium]|nr:hypothetical protein [Burkholderiales bacterium]
MRAALLIVAGVVLIGFIVVAFVLPQMAGSEARAAAEALVAGAEPARQQITASAEKAGNLNGVGKSVKLAPKNEQKFGEMKWLVSDNGEIRGWNEKNALEIAMVPTVSGNKVSWSCRGYPVDAMPPSCGGR